MSNVTNTAAGYTPATGHISTVYNWCDILCSGHQCVVKLLFIDQLSHAIAI